MPEKGKGMFAVRWLQKRLGVSKEMARHIFWDWFVPFEIAVAILALVNAGFIHG